MQNINKISLVGGVVFAAFDAICAFFAAFALQPFVALWVAVAHVKLTGVGVESTVTPATFLGGIAITFVIGYVLTWIFVWLHRKFCCAPATK